MRRLKAAAVPAMSVLHRRQTPLLRPRSQLKSSLLGSQPRRSFRSVATLTGSSARYLLGAPLPPPAVAPPPRHNLSTRSHYSTDNNNDGAASSSCPFDALGVPKGSPYADVRVAFLKKAMECHPDTRRHRLSETDENGSPPPSSYIGDGEEEETEGHDDFLRLRAAFECIVETDDGGSEDASGTSETAGGRQRRRRGRSGTKMSDAEFDAWFHVETGLQSFSRGRLDRTTVQELIDVADGQSPGGLDRGGMWQFARSVRDEAKRSGLPPAQISRGSVGAGGNGASTTAEGRRRRRNRSRRN